MLCFGSRRWVNDDDGVYEEGGGWLASVGCDLVEALEGRPQLGTCAPNVDRNFT